MYIIVFLLFLLQNTLAYPEWFLQYKTIHNKTYSYLDEQTAFNELNAKYKLLQDIKYEGLTLKLHALSDQKRRINVHLKSKRIERRRRLRKHYKRTHMHVSLPPSHDWRVNHYVSTPKVQGSCGGCFAFAAVGHLEFWYKKLSGSLSTIFSYFPLKKFVLFK